MMGFRSLFLICCLNHKYLFLIVTSYITSFYSMIFPMINVVHRCLIVTLLFIDCLLQVHCFDVDKLNRMYEGRYKHNFVATDLCPYGLNYF